MIRAPGWLPPIRIGHSVHARGPAFGPDGLAKGTGQHWIRCGTRSGLDLSGQVAVRHAGDAYPDEFSGGDDPGGGEQDPAIDLH